MYPLVSVIIPSHNRVTLLSRAIESVKNQEYKNWEVIVVDDASTDGTQEAMQIITENDKRIHYYRLQKNSGACVARNVGIKNAKGTYITFLDSDDEYLSTKIAKQVACFQNSKVHNIGVVSCGRLDERNGNVYSKWMPSKKGDIVKNLLQKDRVGANTSFLMVSKEVLDKHNILFDPEMPAGQDYDFLLRVCLNAGFDYVPEFLVTIHHHKGERVYTNERALVALEKQYNKYKYLLVQDKKVHDKFLLKMTNLNYVYGKPDIAFDIVRNRMMNTSMKQIIWKSFIKMFPRYGTLPSKVAYKMLQLL